MLYYNSSSYYLVEAFKREQNDYPESCTFQNDNSEIAYASALDL